MADRAARGRRARLRVGGHRARGAATRPARTRAPQRPGRGIRIAVGVVLTLASLAVAAGTTWTIVQIGESGSRAVWEGSFSDEPLER